MPTPPLADDAQEIGALLVEAVGHGPQSCLLIIHMNLEHGRSRVAITRHCGQGGRQRTVDGRNLIEVLRTLVGDERLRACPRCERELPLKNFNRNGYCLGCEVERARVNREAKRLARAADRRRHGH